MGLPTARVSAVLAGPFPPCLRCGFLPYIQYACEATPWPDAKFLADHFCQRTAGSPKSRSPEAAPLVARRRWNNLRQSRRPPSPPRQRVVDGGLMSRTASDDVPAPQTTRGSPAMRVWEPMTAVPWRMRTQLVGHGILDASGTDSIRGRQGCRPLRQAE